MATKKAAKKAAKKAPAKKKKNGYSVVPRHPFEPLTKNPGQKRRSGKTEPNGY
jgi:hypothetical protein